MPVIGQVAQSPGGLGWTALVLIVLLGGIAYLMLVVASGDDEITGLVDEEPITTQPAPPLVQSVSEPISAEPEPPEPSAADRYARSVALSMWEIGQYLAEVAGLVEGERILDVTTGHTLSGSPSSVLRQAIGEGSAGRALVQAASNPRGTRTGGGQGEIAPLPFPDGWCDAVVSIHSLHRAENPRATLEEWRRVTGRGGRVALTVPGPRAALGLTRYDPIFRRHGIRGKLAVPTPAMLRGWASAAGWREIAIYCEASTTILADAEAFRAWVEAFAGVRTGTPLRVDELDALTRDLMAITPAGPNGLQIPYGALYLTAYNR